MFRLEDYIELDNLKVDKKLFPVPTVKTLNCYIVSQLY